MELLQKKKKKKKGENKRMNERMYMKGNKEHWWTIHIKVSPSGQYIAEMEMFRLTGSQGKGTQSNKETHSPLSACQSKKRTERPLGDRETGQKCSPTLQRYEILPSI